MNSFFKPNEAASIHKPGVINGSKVCKRCIYPSSVYTHGHDLTCPSSEYFGMTRKQKQDAIQEKRRMKALKILPSSEVPNVASKGTFLGAGFYRQKQQATVTAASAGHVTTTTIIAPCTTAGRTTSASMSSKADDVAMPAKVLPAMKAVPEDALSVDTIKVEIKRRLRAMEKEKKKSTVVMSEIPIGKQMMKNTVWQYWHGNWAHRYNQPCWPCKTQH
jgi:hypothetical protein